MRLDSLFGLAFYVTLGLAACCLTLAESFFLPWLGMCLPALFALFLLAWRKEGVWVLGETAANYLGIVIALTAVAWILLKMPQTEEQILASGVPWPAGLLPQLAPVLLILLVVKLFRPKRLPDFWIIQTIGLMMITLGCVLAYQETFGILLVTYVAALLWCLMLFHFYREQRLDAGAETATVPLFDPAAPPSVSAHLRLPWGMLGLYPVALWLAVIVLTSLPLFLIMPRSPTSQWVPQKLSSAAPRPRNNQPGVEAGIDLYRVGHIDLGRDEAFTVKVRDKDGQPATLPISMYWRTDVLDHYQRGRWQNFRAVDEFKTFHHSKRRLRPMPGARPLPNEPEFVLDLQFFLRPVKAGDLVLAEPIAIPEQEDLVKEVAGTQPRVGERDSRVPLFHLRPGTDTLIPYVLMPKQLYSYGQKLHLHKENDRVTVAEVTEEYRDSLLDQAVPEDVREWTRALIEHQPSLQPSDLEFELDPVTNNPTNKLLPQHHAKVARVLTKYLAMSGLFRYSLDLRRKDYNADPTSDFLLNTKQGHCERYASGLALMLRSLGIPARVVKGYRDHEKKIGPEGEDPAESEYLIRQTQAHSWVQALVVEDGHWFWLTLDATPNLEEAKNDTFSLMAWLSQGMRDGRYFWYNFILEYNNDVQYTAVKSLGEELRRGVKWVGRYATYALVPLSLFWLVWYGRPLWPRRTPRAAAPERAESSAPAFYEKYLQLMAGHFGLTPQPGQTPLEFSRQAADTLRNDGRTHAWDLLPTRVTDALYRLRYAAEPLDAAEQTALTEQIAGLEQSIRGGATA